MKKLIMTLSFTLSFSTVATAISKLPSFDKNDLVPSRWSHNTFFKDSAVWFEDNADKPKSIQHKTCRYYLKQYEGEYNSDFENTVVNNLRQKGMIFAGKYNGQHLDEAVMIIEWDYIKNAIGLFMVGTKFRTYDTPAYDNFFRLIKKVRIYMGADLNQYAPDFYMEETSFAGAGIAYHKNKTLAQHHGTPAYTNSYAFTDSEEILDQHLFQYLPVCYKSID